LTGPEPGGADRALDAAQLLPGARQVLRRAALGGAVSLAALVLLAVAVSRSAEGEAALRDVVARAEPLALVAALCMMVLAFFCMGLRWRALMPADTPARPLGLMAIVCSGLLLNFAVPGPVGELAAAWFAHRRYRLRLATALASGIAARLLGLASAAALALLAWLVADLPVSAAWGRLVAVTAVSMGVGGAALLAMAARPRWWRGALGRLLRALARPGRVGELLGRLDRAVGSLADALAETATRGPRAYARALGWSLAGHACVTGGIAVAAAGIGAQVDPAGLLFTYATTTAGAVALFALPGSQVGWDAMFFALLVGTAGLRPADAIAIATVVRVGQLVVMGLGALSLVLLSRPPPEA
jgi:uncharacterized membrane protein YbhN (UPF0104 family)